MSDCLEIAFGHELQLEHNNIKIKVIKPTFLKEQLIHFPSLRKNQKRRVGCTHTQKSRENHIYFLSSLVIILTAKNLMRRLY